MESWGVVDAAWEDAYFRKLILPSIVAQRWPGNRGRQVIEKADGWTALSDRAMLRPRPPPRRTGGS